MFGFRSHQAAKTFSVEQVRGSETGVHHNEILAMNHASRRC